MSVLAIDVGNTNVVLGLFSDDKVLGQWRLQTLPKRPADEYAALMSVLLSGVPQGTESADHASGGCAVDRRVEGIVLASVLQDGCSSVLTACQILFEVEILEVKSAIDIGIPVAYDPPSALGIDRALNAAAAYHLYGGPCIVVDMGTATTYDVVSAQGVFLGGAIAPGIAAGREALLREAPRLPWFELLRPSSVVANTTRECLQSGTVIGAIAQIEGMIARIRGEIGAEAVTVATGGLSAVVNSNASCFDHCEPMLTLYGLRDVWERRSRPLV